MSNYQYIVHDYQAVQSADISLEGITVLAGINGCGKSTLSRWLYYLVNGISRFESLLFDGYIRQLTELVNRMYMACLEMQIHASNAGERKNGESQAVKTAFNRLNQLRFVSENSITEAQEIFFQALYACSTAMEAYLKNDGRMTPLHQKRIMNFLHLQKAEGEEAGDVAERFVEMNSRLAQRLTERLSDSLEQRPAAEFFQLVRETFVADEELPADIHLSEDGVDLLSDTVISTLFNLRRAIYIDTPVSITAGDGENVFWTEVQAMIKSDPETELPVGVKKLLKRVRGLLGGSVELMDVEGFGNKELRFVSDDGVNIGLSKAATGFKTFSYLQRLLENGYLTKETLLLIDEPEAHLHPQWIIEFARLLVLLNKEIGTKVVIASHNPDMVSAIQAIAEKESVLEKTHFYQAVSAGTSHRYVYKDLGQDIEEIFQSFNIALREF